MKLKQPSHVCNLSIQVIPLKTAHSYDIIDKAIAVIQQSGLKYEVQPFSTVLEGHFEELMALVAHVRDELKASPCEEYLLNIQFHERANKPVYLIEKTSKYKKD
jgi:uncharacterized protein YqgV (UPF0045/DUF77 family)